MKKRNGERRSTAEEGEIYPRNPRGATPDSDPMHANLSTPATREPLTEDTALKDAALALADSTTLQEMARDHLRSTNRGQPRSLLLSRLRRSALTGRDAVQYLEGVQLEAAFARARVRTHPSRARSAPSVTGESARRKSAAIAARMLLFAAPGAAPSAAPSAAPEHPRPAPKPARTNRADQPSFLALDFETATNRRDSACAVGAVLVENGATTAEFNTLLRPPWLHVDPRHESIHGLGASALSRAPTFAQVWPKLSAMIDRADTLVAHNAGFDRSVLDASCRTAKIRPPELPWLCTVQMSRRAFNLPSCRLPSVAAHLGVALHHHDAMSDARACTQIALHIAAHQPRVFHDATRSASNVPRAHSAFAAPVGARRRGAH